MRFNEFYQRLINEGGNSKGTQFNSEVGLLAAMCGVDPAAFDPNDPAPSFANSPYTVGEDTFANIQAEAEFYKPAIFAKWVTKVGPIIANKALTELEKLGHPAPTELAWVGSDNQSSVADVKFINHPVDGISVKEKGAPTLANLTAKSLGLDVGEDGDPDVFRHYAKAEWDAVKTYIYDKVLSIAKAQPGKPFAPGKDKYSITYVEGDMPADAKRINMPKQAAPAQPAPAQQQAPQPAPQQKPAGQNTTNLQGTNFNSQAPRNTTMPRFTEAVVAGGYFVIKFGDKSVNEPEDRLWADVMRNTAYQRVFGDYFQAYWGKDQQLTDLGKRLFTKIGADFVSKIKEGLAEQSRLHGAIKMGAMSYFYGTPTGTYYVPSANDKQGLQLHDLTYTSPKGTNQNFLATIGYEDEVPASVLIYIRYANGIFQTNPTVRVQKLTNPQGLGWIKL
jgi:hypothetical protein